MKKIAFIFPGQGSQYPGMGKDFYDRFLSSREIFQKADQILGYEISDIIFNGPKDKLDLTKNAQLGIFITSVAILKAMEELYPDICPQIVAGLSLGEYTALFAAKKLEFESLIKLIEKRADLMTQACLQKPGAMAAVIGLTSEEIQKEIQEFQDLWIANFNTPVQTVISGKKESVEKALEKLAKKTKKVLVLDVQGAFHTPYMLFAEDRLKNEITKTKFLNSSIAIVMNSTADFAKNLDILKTNLIKQITSSVKWLETISKIDKDVDLFIEIGAGRTLTNMNKKIKVKAQSISIEKVEDLERLKDAFRK